MLRNGTCYQDLEANHFNQQDKARHIKRLVGRMENLGFEVKSFRRRLETKSVSL
jgi:hypothetical protein